MPKVSFNESDSKFGWIVSLAFWLVLFCAVGVYASVALSPKLLTYLNLHNEYYVNQVRLVRIEKQVENLGRVVVALETDPNFSAELARIDFDAERPGDERIPVDPELSLDGRLANATLSVPATSLPWYGSLLKVVANNNRFRTTLLFTSAMLTILAFTFLQESQTRQLQAGIHGIHHGFRILFNRYRVS